MNVDLSHPKHRIWPIPAIATNCDTAGDTIGWAGFPKCPATGATIEVRGENLTITPAFTK